VEIWPENMPAFIVFQSMSTQWRMGMNGPTGLDYNVLHEIWKRLEVPKKDRNRVFGEIQEMERVALSTMAKHRK